MNNLGCTLISETGEEIHFYSTRRASAFLQRSRGYVSQCVANKVAITHSETGECYQFRYDNPSKEQVQHVRKRMQPCCTCKKFAGGCAWSARFEPVKGWDAVPTRINQGGVMSDSYMIINCPEYDRG